jgi:hypothetical protein
MPRDKRPPRRFLILVDSRTVAEILAPSLPNAATKFVRSIYPGSTAVAVRLISGKWHGVKYGSSQPGFHLKEVPEFEVELAQGEKDSQEEES